VKNSNQKVDQFHLFIQLSNLNSLSSDESLQHHTVANASFEIASHYSMRI